MPPKSATTTGETGTAAGGLSSLTPKETEMLAAVASLMGGVPEVNFEQLAELVGHKYARNARAACKKLFDKLKANAPAGSLAAGPVIDDANDDEEGAVPATPTKTPKKKGIATPRKVGPRKTPIKAVAPQVELKEESMEDELADDETKHGKSLPATTAIDTFAPAIFQCGRQLPLISSICGYMATFPIGYSFPMDATDEELYKAHLYEITVEDWRSWKLENNYDPDRPITPC